ncbi:MAG: hypothetical protein U0229_08485 [Anaeromyxobacter sp.]
MLALQAVLALYAIVMIWRYLPAAIRGVKGERGSRTYVALFIVAMAVAILVVAVKDLARSLISR